MRFAFDQDVNAPRDLVERAYVSESFYEALGGLPNLGVRQVLERTERSGVVTIRVRLAFTGRVSGPARAIVDPSQLTWVTTTTTTTGDHQSRFEMVPDKYGDRVWCRGTYRFAQIDGGTGVTMEGDLVVKLPFIGHRAEEAIADGFRENLAGQASVLETWTP